MDVRAINEFFFFFQGRRMRYITDEVMYKVMRIITVLTSYFSFRVS